MKDKINPLLDALRKNIMHLDKGRLYSRQKFLDEFEEFYKPKPAGTKKTYKQNWAVYYQAARTEKLMFFRILYDVVEYLDIPQSRTGFAGKPSADLKNILKCLCIKAYSGLSSWRVESELEIAKELKIIDIVYKRSVLNKYLNKPEVSFWLHKIYQTIALPIFNVEDKLIEEKLATDASGISVAYGKKQWVEVRLEKQLHRDYKKLHIISGTRTNIICVAKVTRGKDHESPHLKSLLMDIKGKFPARELSADAGYLSKKNVDLISECGMIPFIMPKKNSNPQNKGKSKGAWSKMIWFWKKYESLFRMHYHARSNVESTFGMLKRKFGYYVRSKSEVGQENEILCKIVCLNAAILGEAMLEFDLKCEFMVN